MTKHNHITRYNLKHGPDHVSEVEKDINGMFIEYSAYEKLQQENERLKDLTIGKVRTCSKHCKRPMCVLRMENERLTKAIKVAEGALMYMTEDYDCDPEDVALYDRRKALEALEQINKIKQGE